MTVKPDRPTTATPYGTLASVLRQPIFGEFRSVSFRHSTWAVMAGAATLAVPTLISLAHDYWSTDNGMHGPILLFTGIWLIWRERHCISDAHAEPNASWLLLILAPLLLVYAIGRQLNVLTAETASLYLILVLLAYVYLGRNVFRRLLFPILYLAFLVRPPAGVIAQLTQPLKIWISQVAASLLHGAGYEIGSSGVRIQVAQYELLVQQACAGLGSIFSLMAIGILYAHLASPLLGKPRLMLLLSVIPVAVLANLLRVIILILLTVHMGEAVAQSFAHQVAGLITFGLALLALMAADSLLLRTVSRAGAQGAR